MDTPNTIKLEQAVFSVMNELQDMNSDKFEYYLQLAIEGYRDINIFDCNMIRVVHLQCNSTGIYNLPSDFITYRKIGILYNGQVWTLTLNNDLALPRHECCGAQTPEQPYVDNKSAYYFAPHYYNGSYTSGLYAVGGGVNISYYRLDLERNQLILSPNVIGKEIILEYKSTGVSMDLESMIPVTTLQAIKAYIHWRRIEFDDKIPMNNKVRKQQLYDDEVTKLRLLENKFTKDEFLDMIYSTMGQSVKR